MIRQLRGGEEFEKRHKRPDSRHQTCPTGSEQNDPTPEDLLVEEIDPAEFFDPEEFGVRRRDLRSSEA